MSASISRVFRCTPFSTQLTQIKQESSVASLKDEIFKSLQPPFSNWSNFIRDAEKIIGNPTSFMNLRCLLSDEFATMALYLKKSDGNNNMVMHVVKKLLSEDQKNDQPWRLAILLLAQSIKTPQTCQKTEEQQKILAELTETFQTGHLIHEKIINLPFEKRSRREEAFIRNKIAIILGDYLIITAYAMLAKLRNPDVHFIISSGVKHMSEGQFFGDRDGQNMPLPRKSKSRTDQDILFDTTSIMVGVGKPEKEWTPRSAFNGVSLLGRGCQSAFILAKQSQDMQNYAYQFGCHLGLAWQAANEYQKLTSKSKEQFCLASAPVLFALEGNPELYKIIDQAKNDVKDVDYEDLKFNILKTDAVEKTKTLYEGHARLATDYINRIGDNDSVNLIKKIINQLKDI